MEKGQLHLLFSPQDLHVRESIDGAAGTSRIVEGCAIVFNQATTLYDGTYERIREVIVPSCITKEFLQKQDIKLNLLHERSMSLARCKNGTGSLKLDLREDGLYFTAEMPRCDIGDRALALIANGTYSGCSFEFYPLDWTTENTIIDTATGKTDTLVTFTAFEAVTALTIAMDPAYEQTSIDIREQARLREIQNDLERSQAEEKQAREEYHKRLFARQRQFQRQRQAEL